MNELMGGRAHPSLTFIRSLASSTIIPIGVGYLNRAVRTHTSDTFITVLHAGIVSLSLESKGRRLENEPRARFKVKVLFPQAKSPETKIRVGRPF